MPGIIIDMLRYHLSGNWRNCWGLEETSIFFFFVCYYITNVEKDIIFCFVDRCRSWKTFWVHKLWLQSSLVPGLGIEFRSCGFCSDAFWLWHTSFLFLSETVKFSGCSWYALQLEEVTKLIYNNLINFS